MMQLIEAHPAIFAVGVVALVAVVVFLVWFGRELMPTLDEDGWDHRDE